MLLTHRSTHYIEHCINRLKLKQSLSLLRIFTQIELAHVINSPHFIDCWMQFYKVVTLVVDFSSQLSIKIEFFKVDSVLIDNF